MDSEPIVIDLVDDDKDENDGKKASSSGTETIANSATSTEVITIGDDDPTEDNKMAKVEDILLLDDDNDNDWRSLDSKMSKLALVNKQVIEAKKIKVTDHDQPVVFRDNPGRFNIKPNDPLFSPTGQPSQKGFEDAGLAGRKRVTEAEETEEVVLLGAKKLKKSVEGFVEAQKSFARTPKVIDPSVLPKPGSVVYALSGTLLNFWLKGKVIEILSSAPGKSPEFLVRFEPTRRGYPVRDGKTEGTSRLTKQVTAKQLAYNIPCSFVLRVGSRIIAKFRDELNTEPIGNGQFYAGVIAEPPKNANYFRYLVFFDNGNSQYVSHREILKVHEASKEVWADVHPDSSEFIKIYVQGYPERPMVRLTVGQIVTTEWNGKWWIARVIELDSSLVKMGSG